MAAVTAMEQLGDRNNLSFLTMMETLAWLGFRKMGGAGERNSAMVCLDNKITCLCNNSDLISLFNSLT